MCPARVCLLDPLTVDFILQTRTVVFYTDSLRIDKGYRCSIRWTYRLLMTLMLFVLQYMYRVWQVIIVSI